MKGLSPRVTYLVERSRKVWVEPNYVTAARNKREEREVNLMIFLVGVAILISFVHLVK